MQLTSADILGFEGGTQDPNFKRVIIIFNALPHNCEQEFPTSKAFSAKSLMALSVCSKKKAAAFPDFGLQLPCTSGHCIP